MILYHGSLEIIEKPAILEPNRTMDYGKGFYTTTSQEQADKWVARKITAAGADKGFTNIYLMNLHLKHLMFLNLILQMSSGLILSCRTE